jgi:hypothetical protein
MRLDMRIRYSSAIADGERAELAAMLRRIQTMRIDWDMDADTAFVVLSVLAEGYAEKIFATDAQLNLLSEKLRAVEQREGLGELDEFDPDHPDTPPDWKALDAESNRRYEEVEHMYQERVVGWLRRHGEFEMAQLYQNDRAEFDRRREAGRCRVYGPLPEETADAQRGDTGVTEVGTNENE